MNKDPRKEFEDLFLQSQPSDEEPLFVLFGFDCLGCEDIIWLPVENPSQVEFEGGKPIPNSSLLERPPERWSEVFGCIQCGRIATYAGDLVRPFAIPQSLMPRFRACADVYHVVFACGEKGCRSPVSLHVDISAFHAASTGTGTEHAVAALRSGVFDDQMLPCGHSYQRIPPERYRVTRVTTRMW